MSTRYIFHLGSHPALSAAEAWGVLTANGFEPHLIAAQPTHFQVEVQRDLPEGFLKGLGGCDRITRLLHSAPIEPTPEEMFRWLTLPLDKKTTVGLSALGEGFDLKRIAGRLKQAARQGGAKLAYVLPPGKSRRLNSAHILFHRLLTFPNQEITIWKEAGQFFVARTTHAQDIVAYEKRDMGRPARDARVGMLPPKLAQIMLNLAVPNHAPQQRTLFDPFCGTGTILQEGWLLGHVMVGSDMSEKMVAAAQTNLEWAQARLPGLHEKIPHVFQHDASQPFPETLPKSLDAIVTEPTLGPPLSAPLPPADLAQAMSQLQQLYRAAFRNFKARLAPGARVLFLFPAWAATRGAQAPLSFLPASFLDEIGKLGYRLIQPVPTPLAEYYHGTERGTLVYRRPDALVAREITLWEQTN